jgi:uncharacterized membrane protein
VSSEIKENLKRRFTTNRIETLVDGIFAISMTLLVLNLQVPQIPSPVTNIAIIQYLFSLIPKFYVYGLSFILLAVFWRINHQEFHRIKKSDNTLIWINVVWLMFVALVPFSTSLVGEYGEFQSAELFFHFNMFFIGIIAFFNWHYAVNHNLSSIKWSKKSYNQSRNIYLGLPSLSALAMGLTFISPSWSSMAYLGIYLFKKLGKTEKIE